MKRLVRGGPAALALAAVVASPLVSAQAPLPKPQMQGSVEYLNGGAGDEEVQFVRQSMKDYTLALGFANGARPRPEYVASVAVTIKDRSGQTVFEAPSVGPFLLVKLPPGAYTVVATYQSQSQTRPVTAGKSASSIVEFAWK